MLRLLLALSVVLTHTGGLMGFQIVGGQVAVQCFFIISGFYISLILNEKYTRPCDLGVFYLNRGLRIYSLYLLTLVFAVALNLVAWRFLHTGPFTRWAAGMPTMSVSGRAFIIGSQLTLFGQDATLFLHHTAHGIAFASTLRAADPLYAYMLLPPAWSLALELTFYLLAPALVRRPAWQIAGLAAAAFALRGVAALYGFHADPWSYRFFPFELGLFLSGALSYKLLRWLRSKTIPTPALLAVGLAVLPAALLFPVSRAGEEHQTFFSAWNVGLLAYAVLAVPCLHLTLGKVRWDRLIGELSFPVYLLHILVIEVLDRGDFARQHPAVAGSAVIAVTLAASALAVRFVDMPINAFRQHLASRSGIAVRPAAVLQPAA